jgi:hypothetical protein
MLEAINANTLSKSKNRKYFEKLAKSFVRCISPNMQIKYEDPKAIYFSYLVRTSNDEIQVNAVIYENNSLVGIIKDIIALRLRTTVIIYK